MPGKLSTHVLDLTTGRPAASGAYRLEDQFGADAGRVTMSGVHALLRRP